VIDTPKESCRTERVPTARCAGIEYLNRGVRWEVHEMAGAEILGARGPRCLVFNTQYVARLVWQFPDDWAALSTTELIALSWRR
jgi:hypothetical protein